MAVKSRTILSFVTIKGGVNILFNSLPYLYLYGLLLYYLENEYTFLRSWTTYSYFFVLLPSTFIIIRFKVDGSKTVSSLEKKADKLERVAKNSPSARNGVQAAEARNAANNANIRNEAAGTATTETTESTINKKTSNLSLSSGGNGGGYNPNAPRQDNTYTKKPVLLPIHQ